MTRGPKRAPPVGKRRAWSAIFGVVVFAAAVPTPLSAQSAATHEAPARESATVGKAQDAAARTAAAGNAATTPPARPAKELFGAMTAPASLPPRVIGYYAKGCLAGGVALPPDGPAWQAMRLSRNRTWGHPTLVALVEKLAGDAKRHDGWPGLLVGDLSQPRGGPMLTGHASHQVGLDVDIWFTPMPDRRLTAAERESISATSMVAGDKVSVDPRAWTPAHMRLLKRVVSYGAVERVFVHPAIKKALCEAEAKDANRHWLSKVRPMWGHDDHFHVRIVCPKDSPACQAQPAPAAADDGCGQELTHWLDLIKRPPLLGPPRPPKPSLMVEQLPKDCRAVLAGTPTAPLRKAGSKKVANPSR
jgi:penicillin-insensitive murein endopeptidase